VVHLKTVHTVPWLHCPNKNVFSNCKQLVAHGRSDVLLF